MSQSPETIRRNYDGASISTYILVLILVPMKLACRLSTGRNSLGLDDAFVIVGFILANAFFYNTLVGIRPMLGHNYENFASGEIISFLKFVFAAQTIYATVLGVIKASLLAFYWRLFSIRSRIPIIAAAFIVFAWTVSTNLVLIFTCDPVEAQWNLSTTATCLNRKKVYLGASIPNVATDVLLLLLPLPYVWKLHAPWSQRVVLGGIFTLGCFVAIVSLIRLTIFMKLDLTSPNVTYIMSPVFIWSSVEINVGLICACLPSLRPAIRMLGLNRIFPASNQFPTPNRADGYVEPSAYQISGDQSRSTFKSSKKRGFFSQIAGITALDEEEDSFQMIRQHNDHHGKTQTNIELARSSSDTEGHNDGRGTGNNGGAQAIKVQRDWHISVNHEDPHGTCR